MKGLVANETIVSVCFCLSTRGTQQKSPPHRSNHSPRRAACHPPLPLLDTLPVLPKRGIREMLQAATAWFSSSQILQNYAIATPGTATAISSSSPAPSAAASPSPISVAAPFHLGPWKVQEAYHKTTQKRASIWTCDKRSTEMERIGAGGKEMVIEVLKAEVCPI